jgi:hypothetical protein
MKKHTKIVIILLAMMPVAVGAAVSGAGDPAAGKAVFEGTSRIRRPRRRCGHR